MNSPRRSTSESRRRHGSAHRRARPGQQHEGQRPSRPTTPAHTRSRGRRGGRRWRRRHPRRRPCRRGTARRGQELGVLVAVLAAHGVPQPRPRNARKVAYTRAKRTPAAVGGVGREHGQQDQHAHLDEDDVACPPVLAAVQLEVHRPVDPGDPDQGEDDGELGDAARRHVLGQVVGGLPDDGDVDEVVEELEHADRAAGDASPCARGGRQNQRLKRRPSVSSLTAST